MIPDERFFVTEAVRFARTLPYDEALKFLRGMMKTCGDVEEIGEVRKLVVQMTANDAQLELIASGQLTFGLDAVAHRPRQKKKTK